MGDGKASQVLHIEPEEIFLLTGRLPVTQACLLVSNNSSPHSGGSTAGLIALMLFKTHLGPINGERWNRTHQGPIQSIRPHTLYEGKTLSWEERFE